MDRLFFHTFSITVPAGGSVEVSCSMEKAASFNFYESDSSNTLGFDFLTGAYRRTVSYHPDRRTGAAGDRIHSGSKPGL